jgi:hypothetical protein
MSIEEQNRAAIVGEVKRQFPPPFEVRDEDEGNETLNVYVNDQNGRRVHTLSFTDLECDDYHENPAPVLAKIKKASGRG